MPSSKKRLIADDSFFFRAQWIYVIEGWATHELPGESQQVRLPESQLSKCVRLEEKLDQSFALSMRPTTEIQVSLLRLRVQS